MIGLGFKVKARKAGSRTLAKEDRGLQPYPNLRPWLKWVNKDNRDLHQQFRIIIFAIIKFINLKYGVMSTEENKTEMVYQVKVNVYCGYQVEDDDYYDCIPDWYGQVMMVISSLRNILSR